MSAILSKLTPRKVAIMRGANTRSQNRYGPGGVLKKRFKPRVITLPKLKCLERLE